MKFVKVPIIMKKNSTGSEDGINIKLFTASPEPQLVEENLAKVFVGCGIASYCEEPDKKKAEKISPDETKPFDIKNIETKKQSK